MHVSYRKYVENSDLLSTWEVKINLEKNKYHSSLFSAAPFLQIWNPRNTDILHVPSREFWFSVYNVH
jgi:hypothetical protein